MLLLDFLASVLLAVLGSAVLPRIGLPAAGLLLAAWLVALRVGGAYKPVGAGSVVDSRPVLRAAAGCLAAASLFAIVVPELPVPQLALMALGFAGGSLAVRRAGAVSGTTVPNVLVRGRASEVSALVEALSRDGSTSLVPVAVQTVDGDGGAVQPGPWDTYAAEQGVVEAAVASGVDGVILVGGQPESSEDVRRLIWRLEGRGVSTYVVPFVADVSAPSVLAVAGSGIPVIAFTGRDPGAEVGLSKVVLDRVLALVALVVLAPVIAATALAVKLSSPGAVLFRQTRVGVSGREFEMLKFRTMVADAETRRAELDDLNRHDGATLFKMEDDPRITGVGRLLRKFSLDELPQLVNVLRGEMSLVGPRPPLPDEVRNYPVDAYRRFCVRPGLTGLWQVSGRSDLDPELSMQLDMKYVEQWSPGLDARILARTPKAVITGRGAY